MNSSQICIVIVQHLRQFTHWTKQLKLTSTIWFLSRHLNFMATTFWDTLLILEQEPLQAQHSFKQISQNTISIALETLLLLTLLFTQLVCCNKTGQLVTHSCLDQLAHLLTMENILLTFTQFMLHIQLKFTIMKHSQIEQKMRVMLTTISKHIKTAAT